MMLSIVGFESSGIVMIKCLADDDRLYRLYQFWEKKVDSIDDLVGWLVGVALNVCVTPRGGNTHMCIKAPLNSTRQSS